jgi:hypothetical protein
LTGRASKGRDYRGQLILVPLADIVERSELEAVDGAYRRKDRRPTAGEAWLRRAVEKVADLSDAQVAELQKALAKRSGKK